MCLPELIFVSSWKVVHHILLFYYFTIQRTQEMNQLGSNWAVLILAVIYTCLLITSWQCTNMSTVRRHESSASYAAVAASGLLSAGKQIAGQASLWSVCRTSIPSPLRDQEDVVKNKVVSWLNPCSAASKSVPRSLGPASHKGSAISQGPEVNLLPDRLTAAWE